MQDGSLFGILKEYYITSVLDPKLGHEQGVLIQKGIPLSEGEENYNMPSVLLVESEEIFSGEVLDVITADDSSEVTRCRTGVCTLSDLTAYLDSVKGLDGAYLHDLKGKVCWAGILTNKYDGGKKSVEMVPADFGTYGRNLSPREISAGGYIGGKTLAALKIPQMANVSLAFINQSVYGNAGRPTFNRVGRLGIEERLFVLKDPSKNYAHLPEWRAELKEEDFFDPEHKLVLVDQFYNPTLESIRKGDTYIIRPDRTRQILKADDYDSSYGNRMVA